MNFYIDDLDEKWKKIIKNEFNKVYFKNIKNNYEKTINDGKIIYPKKEFIFNAFKLTPFDNVKIVLLGQDPYHNENQAMGLSFSVFKEQKIPPSLMNIYKEINQSLNINIPKHGDLTNWAKQGILLLNSILSVEKNKPLSHKDWGWEIFSDEIIKILNNEKENLIFLLWGNYAKSKKVLIDEKKHYVLEAAHPSPLARKGFLGCNHFVKINDFLKQTNQIPINWDLNNEYSLFK